jgi:hypothetical protein
LFHPVDPIPSKEEEEKDEPVDEEGRPIKVPEKKDDSSASKVAKKQDEKEAEMSEEDKAKKAELDKLVEKYV